MQRFIKKKPLETQFTETKMKLHACHYQGQLFVRAEADKKINMHE